MTFLITYIKKNKEGKIPIKASSQKEAETMFWNFFCRRITKIKEVKRI